MSQKTRWDLYIDESGDFSQNGGKDEVLLGGLLVCTSVIGLESREIAQAASLQIAHLPWPLHASFLQRPAYGLLCFAAAHQPKASHSISRLPTPRLDEYRRMLALLSPKTSERLQDMSRALLRGRSLHPFYDDLLAIEREIERRDPPSKKKLQEFCNDDLALLNDFFRLFSSSSEESQHALLVVSAEDLQGSASSSSQGRYFCLLRLLIERAARLLRLHSNAERLEIKVAVKDVFDPTLQRQTPLHTRHLNPLCRQIEADLALLSPASPTSPSLRLLPHPPLAFDADAPFALVLADRIANGARRALLRGLRKQGNKLSLPSWEHEIAAQIGPWPLASCDPQESRLRSHLASGPSTADLLRSNLPEIEASSFQNVRRWAQEQALSWLS